MGSCTAMDLVWTAIYGTDIHGPKRLRVTGRLKGLRFLRAIVSGSLAFPCWTGKRRILAMAGIKVARAEVVFTAVYRQRETKEGSREVQR